jgi:hypothetical protein
VNGTMSSSTPSRSARAQWALPLAVGAMRPEKGRPPA